MKIKMIGTGSITSSRRSSCSLIDDTLLVDCGNGIVKTMLEQNIDISKIEAVLITHLHGDHIFDLPFFLLQRKIRGNNAKCTVYGPVGLRDSVIKLLEIAYYDSNYMSWFGTANVDIVEFDNYDNTVLGRYDVKSYLVEHGKCMPAYGYTISNGDICLGVSGDASYCKGVEEIIQESDISILDITRTKGGKVHMGVSDLVLMVKKYGKEIIPTHMNDYVREYLKEQKIPEVVILDDGESIER